MSERVGLLGAALLSLSLVALVGTLLSPFETVIGGGGGGGDGAGFAASPDAAGRELRQRPPAKGGGRRRWRAERREENDPELVRTCERGDWSTPAECRRSLPCDLRAFDPGPAYNREVIQKSQPREWATNNVDAPNRYFQNGIEWWLHRALPPATPNASALTGARRVFVASYFSYMFIFAPHKVEGSLAATSRGLGGAWRADPTHYVVAHGHPGACVAGTKAQTRLLVDACSSCQAIAAGCIPVIIADDLRLPFARWLDWESFSVRVKEADALSNPLGVVALLRSFPPAKVATMQAALSAARPNFLWHLDPSRPSAVDAVLREMCDS